ncbi:histidine phosphatase family protein [Bailinhaonella thermotolerans]|uniref:Histidine phosphatase family protein n=1 Tax=Bailinhaonella thermotolerans TaxID=1070861 RepID=A0A3A4B8H0_9ACTN|nr:histidine phosphatase family protein [Bailinhaonella thermotolerans]RJL34521.1 histidine phosphatase family protein [Bailinhaonella thermotolerans]
MSRRVVCWRHGQTRWNVEHRFQGHSDIPLNETGVAQAARAAAMLAALRPSLIVSSDLRRAADTARALGSLTGLRVELDEALRERGGGEWEGLTSTEIKARWPEEYASWSPPFGEPVSDVADRVAAAIEGWAAKTDEDGTLVVASHGAALRLGICRLLGLPQDLWSAIGGLGNCSWSVLHEGRSGWRLLEHNAGTLPEPVSSDDSPAATAS